jgi:haloacetate dehalogenase
MDGFVRRRIATPDVELHVAVGGSGPPLLLLHGYPQTHMTWHRVAPSLATRFFVVAPDLRGYGDSALPTDDTVAAFGKRAMARDCLALMEALGHARFAVVGHDRGARVAYRLALDHPAHVSHLAVLDVIPTLEVWRSFDRAEALATWHWPFLAQPPPLPEKLIGADPGFFLERLLSAWAGRRDALAAEAVAEYRRCFGRTEVIHAGCQDYRAGATVDVEDDEADERAGRRIACPLLALWGARGGAAADVPLAVWRRWAVDVRGHGLDCGHFVQEEAPEAVLAALSTFLSS